MKKVFILTEKRGDIIRAGAIISVMKALTEINTCMVQMSREQTESWTKWLIEGSQLYEPNYYFIEHAESYSKHIASALLEFEKIINREKPDLIMVIGDGDAEVACCALAARNMKIPVARIDAGIRQ